MIKYNIKQVIVVKPVVELPEGSQAVSVKHHGEYTLIGDGTPVLPECWQVIYLEPGKRSNQ